MGCRSCGGGASTPLPEPPGIEGNWALRWPHGGLQAFSSEEAARAFADARPGLRFDLLPPVDTGE